MCTTHHDHCTATRESTDLSRPLKTSLLMVGFVGDFYMLREQWALVAGVSIYLLLRA